MTVYVSPWKAADPNVVERALAVASILRQDVGEREERRDRGRTELALFRNHGLLNVLGGSADRPGTWHDVLAVVHAVATEDASIAALLGYHYMTSQLAGGLSSPVDSAHEGRRFPAESCFWGGALNPKGPVVTLSRDGDGYRLDGAKVFSTGAIVADRILVRAQDGELTQLVSVPAGAPGIGYDDGSWNYLGMTLTESGTMTFDAVHVDERDLVGPPSPDGSVLDAPPAATLGTPLIQSMFSAVYLGAARGALLDARTYVKRTSRPFVNAGVERAGEDPYVLAQFGKFEIAVRAGELLLVDATEKLQTARERAGELTAEERGLAAVATYAAKVQATEVALEVTSRVFDIQGARSAASTLGLDRRWRDVRTHTLHDPVAYKLREVGDYALNGTIPAPDLEGYR